MGAKRWCEGRGEVRFPEESPGSLNEQGCWVTPSAREREDSATEKYRHSQGGKGAKVR